MAALAVFTLYSCFVVIHHVSRLKLVSILASTPLGLHNSIAEGHFSFLFSTQTRDPVRPLTT